MNARVDITPTWTGILPALVRLMETAEGREVVAGELEKLCRLADHFNANAPRHIHAFKVGRSGMRLCACGAFRHAEGGVVIEAVESSPKTGEACACKRGVERDNCPACEGSGQKIDFKKIRGGR